MNSSTVFKFFTGAFLVIAATGYSQQDAQINGAVVFLVACATFAMGYFAGED